MEHIFIIYSSSSSLFLPFPRFSSFPLIAFLYLCDLSFSFSSIFKRKYVVFVFSVTYIFLQMTWFHLSQLNFASLLIHNNFFIFWKVSAPCPFAKFIVNCANIFPTYFPHNMSSFLCILVSVYLDQTVHICLFIHFFGFRISYVFTYLHISPLSEN